MGRMLDEFMYGMEIEREVRREDVGNGGRRVFIDSFIGFCLSKY